MHSANCTQSIGDLSGLHRNTVTYPNRGHVPVHIRDPTPIVNEFLHPHMCLHPVTLYLYPNTPAWPRISRRARPRGPQRAARDLHSARWGSARALRPRLCKRGGKGGKGRTGQNRAGCCAVLCCAVLCSAARCCAILYCTLTFCMPPSMLCCVALCCMVL